LLDAHRCLAYWTIEHHGRLPDEIKEKIGEHVFGCDICQEVCPWNDPIRLPGSDQPSEASASDEPCADGSGKEGDALPTRGQWLAMGRGAWRRRWGATAMNRAGRRAVQRNAAASVGATGDRLEGPLLPGAASCRDAGLADAASWALRRLAVES
jgi:epoxyqueuosine reductase